MTKDELNELHEWLLSAAGDASPYESQMLMKAATIVGEKFSVEPTVCDVGCGARACVTCGHIEHHPTCVALREDQ